MPQPPEFIEAEADYYAPDGYRLATYQEVQDNLQVGAYIKVVVFVR